MCKKQILIVFCVLTIGCSAGRMTNLQVEGIPPSAPLPFTYDTIPRVIISPWAVVGGSSEFNGRMQGTPGWFHGNNFVWRFPSKIIGGIVEIPVYSFASVVGGAEIGSVGQNNSIRFIAGISSRLELLIIRIRGDVAFSWSRRYVRKEYYPEDVPMGPSYPPRIEEQFSFRNGFQAAMSFWIDSKITPLVQFSFHREDIADRSLGIFMDALPPTAQGPFRTHTLAMTPALAVRMTPSVQLTLGVRMRYMLGFHTPQSNPMLLPIVQVHYGL